MADNNYGVRWTRHGGFQSYASSERLRVFGANTPRTAKRGSFERAVNAALSLTRDCPNMGKFHVVRFVDTPAQPDRSERVAVAKAEKYTLAYDGYLEQPYFITDPALNRGDRDIQKAHLFDTYADVMGAIQQCRSEPVARMLYFIGVKIVPATEGDITVEVVA